MSVTRKKAVFLDRDGVLCEDTDFVTSFEKMHIFPYAKEAVSKIHEKGYLAIVVTNQSGVARGFMSEEMVKKLNSFLINETGVDAIYYCPHLPPEGNERPPYRIYCKCRKPGIGMFERAAKDYEIDLSRSYMVGDRETDILAGKNAGVKTVFLGKETIEQADMFYNNLYSFAMEIS